MEVFLSIDIAILGISALTAAFLFSLLRDPLYRMYALVFVGASCSSLTVIFGVAYATVFLPIAAALIAILIKSDKKSAPWIAWGLLVVCLCVEFLFNFLGTKIGIEGVLFLWDNPYAPFYAVSVYGLSVIFMVAATIVRIKRCKKAPTARAQKSERNGSATGYFASNGEYYAPRAERNKCASVGNFLVLGSYVLTIFGLRLLLDTVRFVKETESRGQYQNAYLRNMGNTLVGMTVALLGVAFFLGIAAWFCIMAAREYGYEGNSLTSALFIWAWATIVIVVVVIVVVTIVFAIIASGDSGSSSLFNKRTYKVFDESSGEFRFIEYDGESLYAQCRDNKGDTWETFDGGAHFKKCGVYKIKGEDGLDKYIYSTSVVAGIYSDRAGNTYESDDGGMTVRKTENN